MLPAKKLLANIALRTMQHKRSFLTVRKPLSDSVMDGFDAA